jgi:hypothetical protein
VDGLLIVAVPFAVLGLGLAVLSVWAWWSERDWD